MRLRTSSWRSTLSKLGFKFAQSAKTAKSLRTLTQNLYHNYSFAVEALEPRNMLTILFYPDPSPVEPNPCESSWFARNPYNAGVGAANSFGGFNGSGTNATGPGMSGISQSGIRYFDGLVVAATDLLYSAGFGFDAGQTTVWTAYSSIATGDNGNSIANPLIPRMLQIV